jgi:hypothetical protein
MLATGTPFWIVSCPRLPSHEDRQQVNRNRGMATILRYVLQSITPNPLPYLFFRICCKFSLGRLWHTISLRDDSDRAHEGETMIGFKGAHFPPDIILTCVRWYVAYPLSYRHVEELMEERGVPINHATMHRRSPAVRGGGPGAAHR